MCRDFGVLKGKKKRKIEGAREPERATAHFGSSVTTEKFLW